jgi:hypothetical protein
VDLDRGRKEKYEGGDEKGGRTVRTEESRKWDEGPSGEVKRNGKCF